MCVAADKRGASSSERLRHEIRVRGPIGPTLMQAFPALTATRSGGDTLLTGSLDQSALYGVINQLEALRLHLLEIRRLRSDGAAMTVKSHDLCEDDSSRPASGWSSIHDRREPAARGSPA